MTISSFIYYTNSSRNIMSDVMNGLPTSLTEAHTSKGAVYGMEVTSSRTELLKNSMRIAVSLVRTFPTNPLALQRTDVSPTTSEILTKSLTNSEFHGISPKTSLLATQQHISVSFGICQCFGYHSGHPKKKSTLTQLHNGRITLHMFSTTSRSYMGSYSVHAWSSQVAMSISPACSQPVTTVIMSLN